MMAWPLQAPTGPPQSTLARVSQLPPFYSLCNHNCQFSPFSCVSWTWVPEAAIEAEI